MDALQESFIEYYKKWGTEFSKDELIVTNGGSEAIMLTFMTLCDPGDEIVSPEPFTPIIMVLQSQLQLKWFHF